MRRGAGGCGRRHGRPHCRRPQRRALPTTPAPSPPTAGSPTPPCASPQRRAPPLQVWFLPQYVAAYRGPLIARRGDGSAFSVGLADRDESPGSILVRMGDTRLYFRGPYAGLKRWRHLGVRFARDPASVPPPHQADKGFAGLVRTFVSVFHDGERRPRSRSAPPTGAHREGHFDPRKSKISTCSENTDLVRRWVGLGAVRAPGAPWMPIATGTGRTRRRDSRRAGRCLRGWSEPVRLRVSLGREAPVEVAPTATMTNTSRATGRARPKPAGASPGAGRRRKRRRLAALLACRKR